MKPIYQTKFGGPEAPESEQGDCMAACLASIFELRLDEVPDFTGAINDGQWYSQLDRWLAERNLAILMLKADAKDLPAGYSMPGVDSEFLQGAGHSVVALDGRIVHDPRRDTKRGPDDYNVEDWWVFTVRDPSLSELAP